MTLHGVAVSAGIAIGRAFFLNRGGTAPAQHQRIAPHLFSEEALRLENAVRATRQEIEEAEKRVPPELQEQVGILTAHLMICNDPKLMDAARGLIKEHGYSAEWAITEAVDDIAKAFSRIDDPYIRERIGDVRAVAARIIGQLRGEATSRLPEGERIILLAHDLTPTDTMRLSPDTVLCFATQEGGRTSHTGILARSMQIPAVVGISGLEESVVDGDTVILDALRGLLLINPDQGVIGRYEALQKKFQLFQQTVANKTALPAETLEGLHVSVRGNIENVDEAVLATRNGGEGIGLYRTEFSFISRTTMPSEKELYEEYSQLLSAVAPHKVTFRTLDVGADKMLWAQRSLQEANPALGLRAIRFCLRNQSIFRRQLRAILRAGIHGNAALMFPMISGVRELRQAKAILGEVRQELEASKVPFDHDIPVGIMIELPSAVLIADALAKEVDFFSIGTNDLIQYSLGIDRCNRHVAYLYQPLHPAIIRAIKYVADMAHKEGISVSVCGEMASDPYCLPILLGMGIDDFSMSPQAIPGIKHIVRDLEIEECRALMRQAASAATVEAVNRIAKQTLSQRFAEELPFYVSVLDTEEYA